MQSSAGVQRFRAAHERDTHLQTARHRARNGSRAGIRAAAIQSLLATAKANHIEPLAWLKDTLEKLPTTPNSRIDDLLPLMKKSPVTLKV